MDHPHRAQAHGCALVVFPALCLTTFGPRWFTEDRTEIESLFERAMPGPETRPLFDAAACLGIGFASGYAERVVETDTVREAAAPPCSGTSPCNGRRAARCR